MKKWKNTGSAQLCLRIRSKNAPSASQCSASGLWCPWSPLRQNYLGGRLHVPHPAGPGLAGVHEEGHVGERVPVVRVGPPLEYLGDEQVDLVLRLGHPLTHDGQYLADAESTDGAVWMPDKVGDLISLNFYIIKIDIFNDVTKDIILREAILFLLMLACWKETLDIASWVIHTITIVETDYRTSSLKVGGDIDSWVSQLFYNSTPLSCLITTKYSKIIRNERHRLGEGCGAPSCFAWQTKQAVSFLFQVDVRCEMSALANNMMADPISDSLTTEVRIDRIAVNRLTIGRNPARHDSVYHSAVCANDQQLFRIFVQSIYIILYIILLYIVRYNLHKLRSWSVSRDKNCGTFLLLWRDAASITADCPDAVTRVENDRRSPKDWLCIYFTNTSVRLN